MGPWMLRLRAVLDAQFPLVVVVFVLVAGLGGWVTYTTHIAPETTTQQRVAASWETTGQFTHAATVQENNSVFSKGETLRNRTVYFTSVTPELDGSFRWTYDATANGSLKQSVSLSLVIRSVDEGEQTEGETVLWQTSERLNESAVESTSPGETVRVPFTIAVRDVANRTDAIHDQLDASPGQTEVFVRATVDFQGTINGEERDRAETYTLPLRIDGNTYSLGSTDPMTERHETMRSVTVSQSYGQFRTVGGPVLLGISLFGLTMVLTARGLGKLELSREERERLDYVDDIAEFGEWISQMRLPPDAFDRPQAEAKSFGALVDFAIDTNSSVIDDPDRAGYYVLYEGYLYTYRPETDPDFQGPDTVTLDGYDEQDTSEAGPADPGIGRNEPDIAGDVSGPSSNELADDDE